MSILKKRFFTYFGFHFRASFPMCFGHSFTILNYVMRTCIDDTNFCSVKVHFYHSGNTWRVLQPLCILNMNELFRKYKQSNVRWAVSTCARSLIFVINSIFRYVFTLLQCLTSLIVYGLVESDPAERYNPIEWITYSQEPLIHPLKYNIWIYLHRLGWNHMKVGPRPGWICTIIFFLFFFFNKEQKMAKIFVAPSITFQQ